MENHAYGLVESPLDERDYQLVSFLPPLAITLPDEFLDWMPWQTSVKNQEQLGSCASFGGVAELEPFDWKEEGRMLDFSEQFLYGEAKKTDGLPGEGTYLRAILQVLTDTGVCEESFMPYEGRYPPFNPPTAAAYENAKNYKIDSYASVGVSKEEIKRALYQNGPLLVGIRVFQSFESTGSDGIVPTPSGPILGGHALDIPAYNKIGLIAKNSWTAGWGNKGYCTIPWAVWDAINMGEAWSIVDVIAGKKPWEDWPDTDIESGWLVKNSSIFKGYSSTVFGSYNNITQHQAVTVAGRLGLPLPVFTKEEDEASWSVIPTRGWIHATWPQYTFIEERWTEKISRYQFAVVVGRYLKTISL